MRLFARDERRPGRPLLVFGLVAYILVALGGMALVSGRRSLASNVIDALTVGPVGSVGLFVWLVFVMLAIGVLFPGLSLSYQLATMGRNWRTIAGTALLMSAIYSAFAILATVREPN